jgi:2-aminoadipate transaminase
MRRDLLGALAPWARNTRASTIQQLLTLVPRPGQISLALGLPAVETFPARELAQAAREILEAEPTALQYGPPFEPLKHQVAALMSRRGAPCRPEQVFLTAGAQQGMSLLARLLLEYRGSVVTEERIYTGLQQVIEPFEPDVRTVATDLAAGMDVEAVAVQLARHPPPAFVYVIPDGHNPLAVGISVGRRRELAELARRFGVPVIEDDPYGLLQYDGPPVPPVRAWDDEWVFYVGSFSKILAPALRAGWLVVPEILVPRLEVAKEAADINAAPFTQRVISRLLDTISIDSHLDALRGIYRARRDAMLSALGRHFPEEARWRRPAAGLFVWVELPGVPDTLEALRSGIEREGVTFLPGEAFEVHAGRRSHAGIRLNFSHVSCDQIEEGVARLGRVLKRALVAPPSTQPQEQSR